MTSLFVGAILEFAKQHNKLPLQKIDEGELYLTISKAILSYIESIYRLLKYRDNTQKSPKYG